MTEFDDRDDYSAEGNGAEENGAEETGAEARELFARTVTGAEDRPRLAFTAEDLVLGGRRRVRRRRVGAALAGTASVAAVAVAATAFGVGGAAGPASDSDPALRDAKLASAAFGELFSELDPGGHHLATIGQKPDADFFLKFGGSQCDVTAHVIESYGFEEAWTAGGEAVGPRNSSDTSPWVHVVVSILAPGGQEGRFPTSVGWEPNAKATLSDGSVVQTASAAGGHELKAVRTLSDQRKIVVMIEDASVEVPPSGAPSIRPTEPFPYTAQQLGGIVGGLSLPLPFAAGYRPQGQCGAGAQ